MAVAHKRSFSKTRPMLRDDLVIAKNDRNEKAVYLVRDPVTDEVFEFGEEEYLILSQLDGVRHVDEVVKEFQARTGISMSQGQLTDFVEMLGEWHLLSDAETATPRTKSPRLREVPRAEIPASTPEEQTPLPPGTAHAPFEDVLQAHADEPLSSPQDDAQDRNIAPANEARTAKLLYGLACVFGPLKWLVLLAVPIIVMAGLFTLVRNIHLVQSDLKLWTATSAAFHMILCLFTVNLFSEAAQGVVTARTDRRLGTRMGIKLAAGFIPRFRCFAGDSLGKQLQPRELWYLTRRERLWIHGTPLLAIAIVVSLAIIGWYMTRSSGYSISPFLYATAGAGLIYGFFTGCPLAKRHGYTFLASYLERPEMRERAIHFLLRRVRGRGVSDYQDEQENRAATYAYALASLLYVVVLIGTIMIAVGLWLELNYQGTGVAIFILFFTFVVWQLKKQGKVRKQSRYAERKAARARDSEEMSRPKGRNRNRARGNDLALAGAVLPAAPPPQPRRNTANPAYAPTLARTRPLVRWWLVILLGILGGLLFLPYPYETGGPASILSVQQQEIHVETDGVLEEVFYSGGEWLPKGTVIGRLSTHEQNKNIAITRAAIAEQEAIIEQLVTSPRPAEVELAERRLKSAQVSARFSTQNANRYEKLYGTKSVSLDDLEDARRKAEVDQATVVERQANLRVVVSGVHPKEIEAAESELEALQEQLAYHQDQLRRTELVIPFEGQLVSPDLARSVGQYFKRGELFTVTEDAREVRVEVAVPQSDIGDIMVGAKTRLKIWTYPNRIFEGTVLETAPTVEKEDFGKVLKVVSVIPNHDNALKSGMTGFGKIEGGEKPVYAAFSGMILRFLLVEAWSWLP